MRLNRLYNPIRRILHRQSNKFSSLSSSDHYYIYTHLLQICLRQCKNIQSRRVFDEMAHRVLQASNTSKIIHARSLILGFGLEGKLGNSVVDLYAKCGNLDFAEKAYARLKSRDVFARNSIMSMYSRRGSLELVASFFGLLKNDGVSPNQFTYAIVLSTCARLTIVVLGKQIHCDVIKTGFESNSFCEGSLIDMYAKCGSVNDARFIFDRVVDPDTVSWTAMIAGYVQIGLPEEALKVFERMQELGHVPDQVAFVTVISTFVSLGRLDEANKLFVQMPNPNFIAWNAMISGHVRKGNEVEAIEFFQRMRKTGVKSTRSTLGSVFSAIAKLEALCYGVVVQALAVKQGLDSNVYVGSSLINMYAKCEKMEDAKRVFDGLNERNVVLWNAMLGGYVQNGCYYEVVKLFFDMKNSGFEPDDYSYTSILSACGNLENLELGRQFHSYIIKNKLASNLFVGNALVDMYAKSGSLKEARQHFERIKKRDKVSWNAMIVGYVQEEDNTTAFNLFKQMNIEGITPDEVSFASILSACANLQSLEKGQQVHCLSIKVGLESGLYVGSSLIDMYAKSGEIPSAHTVFSRMPNRSVVSMNALIAGYAQISLHESINLLKQMQVHGLSPSGVTFTSLLDATNEANAFAFTLGTQFHSCILKKGILYDDEYLCVSLLGMYIRYNRKADTITLFSELPNPKSPVLWTVLISGYAQNGCNEEALQFYRMMRSDSAVPDQATFASALKACAVLASLVDGRTIHCVVVHTGFDRDELTSSALADMYAKCGDMTSSMRVFKEMDSRNHVISWNSMIGGFAKNGYADNALTLFHEMIKAHIKPDDVTFLNILTACSHAGRVSEAREIYHTMVDYYGIKPRADHCACVIDIFGRWGFLREAEEFIEKSDFESNPMIWATLLGACTTHGDDVRGLRAAEKLFKLDPESSSPYVLLANMYAKSGNWMGAKFVRNAMKQKGVRKLPGCSWVELAYERHLFVAADKFHPNTSEIYASLNDLITQMKDYGYLADTGSFLHDEDRYGTALVFPDKFENTGSSEIVHFHWQKYMQLA